jgi:tetratricopeptide (TPR) repeat protein
MIMREQGSGIILIIIAILTGMLTFSCSMKKPGEDDLLIYAKASSIYHEARYAEAAELLLSLKNFPPALVLRGKALFFSGDTAAAEKCLRRALRLNPGGTEAGLYLARLLREKGELEEAEKLTEFILSGDPQNIRTLRLASDIAKEKGPAYEAAALAFLDLAIEASGETALVFLDRAKLRWISGNKQGAMEDLKKSRELLPGESPLMRAIKTLESAIANSEGESAS